MARATEAWPVLIVAHGSPSAPSGPERALGELAAAVEQALPGQPVRSATLAAPNALEAALEDLGERPPLVLPFFMADGWFVQEKLPQRLAAAGRTSAVVLQPLGLMPALHQLCVVAAREGAVDAGYEPRETTVLLAAHGSPSDPRPRRAAAAAADSLSASGVFREFRLGFIDETPDVTDAARLKGPAVCLPFFALRAGHVELDLPRALAAAGFDGPLLAPIGCHPAVVQILCAAVDRASGPARHAAGETPRGDRFAPSVA